MKDFYTVKIQDSANVQLTDALLSVKANPYLQYNEFKKEILDIIKQGKVPSDFIAICDTIDEKVKRGVYVHYIKNCPVDPEIMTLDIDDPRADKIKIKKYS